MLLFYEREVCSSSSNAIACRLPGMTIIQTIILTIDPPHLDDNYLGSNPNWDLNEELRINKVKKLCIKQIWEF